MDNFFLNNEIKPAKYNRGKYLVDLVAEYNEDNVSIQKIKTFDFNSLREANSIFNLDDDVLLDMTLNYYDDKFRFINVNDNISVGLLEDDKFICTLDHDSNMQSILIFNGNNIMDTVFEINHGHRQIVMKQLRLNLNTKLWELSSRWYKYNNNDLLSSITYFENDRLKRKKIFDYNPQSCIMKTKTTKYRSYNISPVCDVITVCKYADSDFDKLLYEYQYHNNSHHDIKRMKRFYYRDDIAFSVEKSVR